MNRLYRHGHSIFCVLLALLLALSSLTLFSRNAQKAQPTESSPQHQVYPLQGQAPFLVYIAVTHNGLHKHPGPPVTVSSSDNQATLYTFTARKPGKKQSGYLWLDNSTLVVATDNRAAGLTSVKVQVKYIDAYTAGALLLNMLLLFAFSWLMFVHYPASLLTWSLPLTGLIYYIASSGNGFAQYSLCLSLLVATHLCWINQHKRYWRNLASLCFILIYPVLLMAVYHFYHHGRIQDSEMLAILQSNTGEALDYIKDFVGWGKVTLWVLLMLGAALLGNRLFVRTANTSRQLPGFAGLALLAVVLAGFGLDPWQYPGIKELKEAQAEYSQQIQQWEIQKATRLNTPLPGVTHKQASDEVLVLVIGESLSRHHMGLYGYGRNTTPLLAKEKDLLVFTDVISNHTQTLQSVFHMITNADNHQRLALADSVSLLNIARAAGMKSYWISNQTKLGFSNNWISILASEADDEHFINKTASGISRNRSISYDEKLLPLLEKKLADPAGTSKLLITHLFGSHSTYAKRYPEQFAHFHDARRLEIGKRITTADQTHNEYDNSVLYNDFILHQMISQLKRKNCVCLLVYSPDHGENLVDDTAHNARFYDPLMVEIPLLIWASERWIQRYPQKMAILQQHVDSAFMNDHLFDTVIGLLDIDSHYHNADNDLGSEHYRIKPRYTLHGEKAYHPPGKKSLATNTQETVIQALH